MINLCLFPLGVDTKAAEPKSGKSVDARPYKKARLSSPVGDDKLAQRRNLELLSNTEEGALSCSTFSNLVEETYQMRRKFITEEVKSSKEILDMCPYLGKSSHVSLLMKISFLFNVQGFHKF